MIQINIDKLFIVYFIVVNSLLGSSETNIENNSLIESSGSTSSSNEDQRICDIPLIRMIMDEKDNSTTLQEILDLFAMIEGFDSTK